MNDPTAEIVDVVHQLTTSPSPAAQRRAILRYFTHDAGFQHPLCTVERGQNSREAILAVYQWYRDMSPSLQLTVESSAFDSEHRVVYLNVVQTFHVWLSPFKPSPSRLLVRIDLQRSSEDDKFYITQQTDYYQPEDVLALAVPFLVSPLAFAKRLAAAVCGYNAFAYGWMRSQIHFWTTPHPKSEFEHRSTANGGAIKNN